METVDNLKRCIDQAGRYLPLDQLALSPQCGFGGIDSKVLSEDEMWRKLDMIVKTAKQVWNSSILMAFIRYFSASYVTIRGTFLLQNALSRFMAHSYYRPAGCRIAPVA